MKCFQHLVCNTLKQRACSMQVEFNRSLEEFASESASYFHIPGRVFFVSSLVHRENVELSLAIYIRVKVPAPDGILSA